MAEFLVRGVLVDHNGEPVKKAKAEKKPDGPFTGLSPAAQKSLAEAGIKTVAEAKTKGREELIKLDNIGEATASSILDMPTT